MGIPGLTPNLSVSLGAGEVTPLDITAAYSAFANGGRRVEAKLVQVGEDGQEQDNAADDQRALVRRGGARQPGTLDKAFRLSGRSIDVDNDESLTQAVDLLNAVPRRACGQPPRARTGRCRTGRGCGG